jgi:hypothetical protein
MAENILMSEYKLLFITKCRLISKKLENVLKDGNL